MRENSLCAYTTVHIFTDAFKKGKKKDVYLLFHEKQRKLFCKKRNTVVERDKSPLSYFANITFAALRFFFFYPRNDQ